MTAVMPQMKFSRRSYIIFATSALHATRPLRDRNGAILSGTPGARHR